MIGDEDDSFTGIEDGSEEDDAARVEVALSTGVPSSNDEEERDDVELVETASGSEADIGVSSDTVLVIPVLDSSLEEDDCCCSSQATSEEEEVRYGKESEAVIIDEWKDDGPEVAHFVVLSSNASFD